MKSSRIKVMMLMLVVQSICISKCFAQETNGNLDALQQQIRSWSSTPENIQEKLTRPLVSDEPLETLNGKKFSAQIGCENSQSFLEVFIKPGPSGDIQTGWVKEDADLDGQVDNAHPLPGNISGVCANGIIRCQPGTWDNCQHFLWRYNQMTLSLVRAKPSDLGGCYCINNHCGNQLVMQNLNRVLGDLGGGISGSILSERPSLVINEVRTEGPIIRYYAKGQGACDGKDATNTHHIKDLAGLYKNPHKLSKAAFDAKTTHTLYTHLSQSSATQNNGYSQHQCEIRREVGLDEFNFSESLLKVSGNGKIGRCGASCVLLALGEPRNEALRGLRRGCKIYTFDLQLENTAKERVKEAKLTKALSDEAIQLEINGKHEYSQPIPWEGQGLPSDCDISSVTRAPNQDLTATFQQQNKVNLQLRVAVGRKERGEGYVEIPVLFDNSCKLTPEAIHNQCRALEKNPECQLETESVDGVVTFQSFASTGLTPLPQERRLTGQSCTKKITRDWFKKVRTYRCKSQAQYDFERGMQRLKTIKSTASETGYVDTPWDKKTGAFLKLNHQMSLAKAPGVEACSKVCKVKAPRKLSEITQSGVVSQKHRGPRWRFHYKSCGNNECPLDGDEQIMKPCGCINEFADAAAIMQTIRQAGQDIICSSGQEQSLR